MFVHGSKIRGGLPRSALARESYGRHVRAVNSLTALNVLGRLGRHGQQSPPLAVLSGLRSIASLIRTRFQPLRVQKPGIKNIAYSNLSPIIHTKYSPAGRGSESCPRATNPRDQQNAAVSLSADTDVREDASSTGGEGDGRKVCFAADRIPAPPNTRDLDFRWGWGAVEVEEQSMWVLRGACGFP